MNFTYENRWFKKKWGGGVGREEQKIREEADFYLDNQVWEAWDEAFFSSCSFVWWNLSS